MGSKRVKRWHDIALDLEMQVGHCLYTCDNSGEPCRLYSLRLDELHGFRMHFYFGGGWTMPFELASPKKLKRLHWALNDPRVVDTQF